MSLFKILIAAVVATAAMSIILLIVSNVWRQRSPWLGSAFYDWYFIRPSLCTFYKPLDAG